MNNVKKNNDKVVASEETGETSSRRKFLKGGLAAAAGTVAVGFPMIATAAKPVVLKLQGAWGGGIFKEYAVDYVKRVN